MTGLRLSPLMTMGLLALLLLNAALMWMPKKSGALQPPPTVVAGQTWKASTPTGSSVFRLKPIASYSQIASRPIFSKSRRPYVAPVPELAPTTAVAAPPLKAPEPLPEPKILLSGIATDGKSKRALIATAALPNGDWHVTGDTVEGWVLSEINADSIALTNVGQIYRLAIFAETKPAPRQPPGKR
jgi:hypothetical protein